MTLLEIVKARIPTHWSAEESRTYGIIIGCAEGAVTIDEKMRNFESGCSVVRQRGDYKGAKWKEQLANAAITRLIDHEQYWIATRKGALAP